MKTIDEIISLTEIMIEKPTLQEWITSGWIRPIEKKRIYYFEEIDIARIQFICDIKYRLKVEDETIPVILSLMDQLYGTRARMNALISAIEKQPRRVQADIFSILSEKI